MPYYIKNNDQPCFRANIQTPPGFPVWNAGQARLPHNKGRWGGTAGKAGPQWPLSLRVRTFVSRNVASRQAVSTGLTVMIIGA